MQLDTIVSTEGLLIQVSYYDKMLFIVCSSVVSNNLMFNIVNSIITTTSREDFFSLLTTEETLGNGKFLLCVIWAYSSKTKLPPTVHLPSYLLYSKFTVLDDWTLIPLTVF